VILTDRSPAVSTLPLSRWHEFKETGLALLIARFPLHFSRPVFESIQRLPQRIDTPMHFAALIPSRIAVANETTTLNQFSGTTPGKQSLLSIERRNAGLRGLDKAPRV
jgi:hypothetical protein